MNGFYARGVARRGCRRGTPDVPIDERMPPLKVIRIMRRSLLLRSLFLAAGLAAAVVARAAPGDERGGAPANAAEAGDELSPQWLYQYLLAEIASQRGQFDIAGAAYADLAKKTRDPRVARRATEVALHTRRLDAALTNARLWVELAPTDTAARQMLASLLAAGNKLDELADFLGRELAAAGPQLDATLMRLNRSFARMPDKIAVSKLVDKLTEPYRERAEARFARAQAAVNAGDIERGVVEIDAALTLRPDWEPAALFKAQHIKRGPEAVAFLEQYVAANPKSSEVRLALARALVGEKRYEDSLREFRLLLDEFPDNPDVVYANGVLLLQLGKPAEAEPVLVKAVGLGKGDPNPARYYLGQIAEEDKRYDEALRRYDEVSDGEHQTAAVMRGAHVLARMGRLDAARERLSKAREKLPEDASRFLIAESQLLRDAGRNQDAHDVLHAALTKTPDDTELLYETALAAERLERVADAERHLRRVIELKPESAQGYNALGFTLADRNVRLDEARQLIDKALSISPDDPFILDSKGWILFRQGDSAAALETLKRAFSMRPDPEIAAHIGEVLWALGRRDEASAVWRDAAKNDPSNAVLTATIKRFQP